MKSPAAPPVEASRADLLRIPGPRGTELVSALRALASNPHEYLLELALRYGPIVCLPFPLESVVLVNDADVLAYIFHENPHNYLKQTARFRALAEIMGEGLFTTDGDVWRRQRQRAQPAFHQDRLAHFERVVASETDKMLLQWRDRVANGRPFALNQDLLSMSLLTIVKAMFGTDIGAVAQPAVAAFAQSHVFINPVSLVNLLDPPRAIRRILAPGFAAFERSLRLLHGIIDQIIRERTREPSDTGDLLSMLIAGKDDESGNAMTERQVRDEVMTMFMAGHETVAIALTWTLYLLSHHPTTRRELTDEIDHVLAGRTPTIEDLPRLPFTRMVLEESMRLYPPGWGIDRLLAQNDILGGYKIPAGTTIGISMYVVHRLPAYWTNPEGFDPRRFSPEASAGRPPYAYFPFGGGARRCIGMRFAMVQMQLVLAAIVQQFDVDLLPGPPVAPRPRLNFAPSRDVLVNVRLRTAAA